MNSEKVRYVVVSGRMGPEDETRSRGRRAAQICGVVAVAVVIAYGVMPIFGCGSTFAASSESRGTAEDATAVAVSVGATALSVASSPAQVVGDTATAHVVVGELGCSVQLKRDAKAARGWLVSKLDCNARK